MKNILTFGLMIILLVIIFVGCSNGNGTPETTTQEIAPETTSTEPETTATREDISLVFPTEFTVRTGEEDFWDFLYERRFRHDFFRLSRSYTSMVPSDEYNEWILHVIQPSVGIEPTEPRVFSFIKHFDISFGEMRGAAQRDYLFWRERNANTADEEYEVFNPYLLFTFNLERINDYYSLDPARHTSARLWLEEWLQHNEPYASYSAFRAANLE